MTFSFHHEARQDLKRAVTFYEECSAGLGYDFLEEVYAAIKRIQAYPFAWSFFSKRTRRCFTHRFPYSVIYRVNQGEILILAVAHSHQKPDYWYKRLKK